jgi:hypothetical protein
MLKRDIELGRWYLVEDDLPPNDLPVIGMYSGGCWFAGFLDSYGWSDGDGSCAAPDYWMVPKKPTFAPVKGKC